MRILFSLLLSLSLVACGDDDARTDAGTMDAGPTGTDTGPTGTDTGPTGTDAGPTGTDAGPTGTDAGPTDAGTPGPGVQALIDGLAGSSTASCACDFTGYSSADECASVGSVSAPYEECFRAGFDDVDAAGQATLECYGMLQIEVGTCLTAAGCDDEAAVTACDEAAQAAYEACDPDAIEAAFTAFSAATDMCATTAADTCPDGEASEAVGASVFSGVTVGGANNYESDECNYATPERSHLWTAPSAGSFTIDTNGSDFDTNLAIFADCEAAEALDCNDDSTEETLYSSVTRTFEAGESVLVVVEGYSGEAGNYVINIQADAE